MERKLNSGRISSNYSVMKVSVASWTPHGKVSVLSRFRSSFGRFIVLNVFWGLGEIPSGNHRLNTLFSWLMIVDVRRTKSVVYELCLNYISI